MLHFLFQQCIGHIVTKPNACIDDSDQSARATTKSHLIPCCVFTGYCRFGNFREIFISRIFISRLIGEFLNSQASIQFIKIKLSKIVVFNISKTLNSQGNEFANISEN